MKGQVNWKPVVIIDAIIILGTFALVLQTNNPHYLWLLLVLIVRPTYNGGSERR